MNTEHKKPSKGWFSVIQYCPDLNRLEAANIGVLLFCPERGYLDSRVASDNSRIRKFFGKGVDLKQVDTFKKGVAERIANEQSRISDHEQLLDFVDRRANAIRISQPRSLRVTEPEQQLETLFAELVGGGTHKRSKSFKRRLSEVLEQPELLPKRVKSVAVKLPLDGTQLEIPYAFQNGRFNLIKPVSFQSENSRAAYQYAVEGEWIFDNADEQSGERQLIVAGYFRGKNDENKPRVKNILKRHNVKLYAEDELDDLAQEILATGKDVA